MRRDQHPLLHPPLIYPAHPPSCSSPSPPPLSLLCLCLALQQALVGCLEKGEPSTTFELAHILTSRCSGRTCGTIIDDARILADEAHFQELLASASNSTDVHIASDDTNVRAAPIPVYFHVIRKDNTTQGGNIPYVSRSHRRSLSSLTLP